MTSLCGVGERENELLPFEDVWAAGVSDFAAVEYRETLIGL